MNSSGGQKRTVRWAKLRLPNLAAQDRQLMPQHEQFDVFHVQAATATNQRAQHSPNGDIEKGEDHAADPRKPRVPPPRHRYWRLFRMIS
jgi:hypothetical protein